MLHSIMPMEFIYGEQTPEDHVVDYVYQGLLMEVKPLTTGKAIIVRLINPPLDCYLDQRYAPGALIPFQQ
ncbi:YlzJ-like family protein [Paenibacillus septentrionalis]|uniref:YlzJ-like family protein n=1 Tax=Paenibacillus septentrionalis TaxID=429342 RepID=A0ABW1V167_9BACL